MKATQSGSLTPISKCQIVIPTADGDVTIKMRNLPDISDSKSAVYNSEAIMGRSIPLYTFSHSADRTINIQIHFFVINEGDADQNLTYLNTIQSAVYPRNDAEPYRPPAICRIKCGELLAADELCVVLQSYSVKFPTEVAWDDDTYCPFRFDVDTTWIVVYSSEDLPWASRIVTSGR